MKNFRTSSARTYASQAGMLTSAIPLMLLSMPSIALAQNAENTASIAVPSGVVDAVAGNNSATDSDTVFAALVAVNDSAGSVNGAAGGTAVVNAFTADTVNGAAASASNAALSVAAGSTVPAGLTFNTATGNVDVAAGTAAGTYSFDYTICETLNPANCKTATISVTVIAASIAADADSASSVNGASGAAGVVDVLDGDTLNGAAASLASVDISVVTAATPASAGALIPALNVATGLVDVPAGTPAGTYVITYEICEELNPTNCSQNSVTVEVAAAALVAVNDSAGSVNGAAGGTAVVNAFTADTVNGAAASASNAALSVAAGSTVPAGLTFNTATGNVDVAAGTAAGTYSFDYTICETLNPANCKTATISVTVIAASIAADADSASSVNGASGAAGVVDVLDGDTLNGAAASLASVDISVVTAATPASAGALIPALNVATGLVDVPAGTPAGTYVITYEICEELNPTNCSQNSVTVEVAAAALVAVNDSAGSVNGAAGGTAVVNAFTADTVNGAAASASNAALSVAAGSTVPAGLTFNTATGNVDVAAGTAAGTYSFDYTICETLNPANCKTATISVTVIAASIAADADSASSVNGASGAAGVVDVLDGDTLNGAAASLASVDISVVTAATPASAGALIPALNVATGLVDVPAGTPAGTYVITYEICEELNPTNCSQNSVTVEVAAAALVAVNDSAGSVNGAAGGTAVVNAFTADTVNGAAASASNAALSVAAGSTVPAGLTFNTATGNVDVAAGTAAGTYSFDYTICETLNPANCKTATISVTVIAASIAADADSASSVNGASGAAGVVDVLDGDTLNGAAASLASVDISVVTAATPASAGALIPALNVATGLVDVPAGTPAGTYVITYEICEELNPTNCSQNSVTVEVAAAALVAVNDSAGSVNGAAGGTAVVNAFTADTVNGAAASASNAALSVAAGSTVPAGLTFNTATGNVDVAAGTAAGTYSFDYTICETLNPANCKTATISVTVIAASIAADADSASSVNGASGAAGVVDVLDGDTLNGAAASLASVDISVVTAATPASAGALIPALNVATGLVDVPAGTPAGTYVITYEICEELNPTNCSQNSVTVEVAAAALVAVNDSAGSVNGAAGGTAVVNAFTADTVNGAAASASNAALSVAAGSTVPAGLTFNTATGNVDVAAGTAAGTYSFDYTICETLNPANCKTATISVTVIAASIAADADSASSVNGASGAAGVVDVLDGDTLNGAAASLASVDISVVTAATPASAGALIPALNVATGLVDVPAGTPAGTYVITYEICEELNPTNCSQNSVTVEVAAAALVAVNDSAGSVNGAAGGTAVVNAFTADTVNGAAASASNAALSVAAGSTVPAGLTFNTATGNVDVAAGTAAGTYSFDYTICETLNPANCKTATISVTVIAASIAADADSASSVNGASGAAGVVDVLDGDTLNGAAASLASVDISVVTAATPASAGALIPALNVATGLVDVPAGTPAGTYVITYEICEELNPTNCSQNSVTVEVAAAALVAVNDSAGSVNGAAGGTAVVNAFTADTVNGAAASASNAALSVAAGSTVPAGLTFNTATGNVDVAAGTAAGTYSFDYTICETLNPANCKTATISVTVIAASIAADADSASSVNGASGAAGVVDVLDGDTLNGAAASLASVDISVVTAATPASAGALIPALNVATGLVDVPAGTPAGTYVITYEICEELNPTNCSQNSVTVEVAAAALVAVNDSAGSVNGAAGGTAVVNAFTADTVNGAAASASNAALSVAAGSTVPAGLTFNTATGNVDVAAGTAAGTYSFDYTICETLNPANCKTATISVTVIAGALVAGSLTVPSTNGTDGNPDVANVLDPVTINGAAATSGPGGSVTLEVTVPASPATPGAPVPSLDPVTGIISVSAGTPAGVYPITYEICETLNPDNCVQKTVTVEVGAAEIVASSDEPTSVQSGIGSDEVVNVFANDTINGNPVDPAEVTARLVSPATDTGVALDLATGVVSVGPDVPEGTYTIEYEICEELNPTNCAAGTVTVVVDAALSTLEGVVYTDVNGNGEYDSGDTYRVGWIVEVRKDDALVAAVHTDAEGKYSVAGLPSGDGYSIAFRNPENDVVYDVIDDVILEDNVIIVDQNLPIDPSGIFYDSVNRTPIPGVLATLLDRNGNALPAVCYVDASQDNQTSGSTGEYRFDIVPGAAPACPTGETEYEISITPPAGYSALSSVIAPLTGPFDPTGLAAPVRINPDPTIPTIANPPYYLTFRLGSGDPDIVFNHIPLDPFLTRTPLVVTKTSFRRSANVGDAVLYEITVRNTENAQRSNVDVIDILPPGMNYVLGTGVVDGVQLEPEVNNRQVLWSDQVVPANGSVSYNLTLVVGAGVTGGEKVNTGLAQDGTDGSTISNRGTAVVAIVPSAVFDCSEVIGKVFEDANRNGYQDENEPGVPSVRLATVNGQLITTDEFGRYHIACAAVPDARIGSNFVLKVDTRTLPLGWDTTSENPRSVRLTRGKFGELNFGVAPQRERERTPDGRNTQANSNERGE